MKKKLNLPIRGALYPRIRKMLMYMKTTCLFILLAVAQVFAANSYAQTANISIHLTNATVEKALQSIEDQTEYYFLYSRSVVDVKREVNIEVEEAKIDQLLNSLLKERMCRIRLMDGKLFYPVPRTRRFNKRLLLEM